MKINIYKDDTDYILIDGGYPLNHQDQLDLIKWFWKYKPELLVYVLTDTEGQLERLCKIQSEANQRFTLNWLLKNKPELLKEYIDKLEVKHD